MVADVNYPCTGIYLLPYQFQRDIARRFVGLGHTVSVRRDRNGSRKVRIDGKRTELCVRDAMARMERAVFPNASNGGEKRR